MPYKLRFSEYYRSLAAMTLSLYDEETGAWKTGSKVSDKTVPVNKAATESMSDKSMAHYEVIGKIKGSVVQPYITVYMWRRTA